MLIHIKISQTRLLHQCCNFNVSLYVYNTWQILIFIEMAKNVVVSLSGGMDSSTLLLRCLSEYDNVTAISFHYGQKHSVELEKAKSLIDYIHLSLDLTANLLNIF